MLFGVTHSECVPVALKERVWYEWYKVRGKWRRWEVREGKIDWRAGEILDGMLKGAWHRRGDGGLQERHVHREASLWLFIYGLAALQWRPYHHNEHRGRGQDERTHSEHSPAHNEFMCGRQTLSLFLFLFSSSAKTLFHFLSVASWPFSTL